MEILQCVNVAGSVLTPETADGSITVNHVHDVVLTLHKGTPATCTENGRKAYYTCSNCDNLISAEDGTTVLTEADLVIEKTGHVYGEWLSDETGHWHECACGEKTNTEAHTPGDETTSTTPQTCTECGYVIEPANGDSTLCEIIKKTLVTVIVLCHRLFRWIFNLIVNICKKI